jgi:hypothetical protein
MMNEADYLTALHGFIADVTGLDGKVIFRGFQSRNVLPKKGAYCIYTPLFRERQGTNVYAFNADGKPDNENGVDSITALVLIDVQVDFYSSGAALNAQSLEIASCSYIGSDWFTGKGLDVRVCGADTPRNLTGIDQSNQYEERWSVKLTTEVNSTFENGLPWFEDVHFRHIVGTDPTKYKEGFINVDVDFPPTE